MYDYEPPSSTNNNYKPDRYGHRMCDASVQRAVNGVYNLICVFFLSLSRMETDTLVEISIGLWGALGNPAVSLKQVSEVWRRLGRSWIYMSLFLKDVSESKQHVQQHLRMTFLTEINRKRSICSFYTMRCNRCINKWSISVVHDYL